LGVKGDHIDYAGLVPASQEAPAIIAALSGAITATLGGIAMLIKASVSRRRYGPERRIESLIRAHERCKTQLEAATQTIRDLQKGQADHDARVTALEKTVRSLGLPVERRSSHVRTRSTDR
jgi:hypothetical protein